MRKHGKGDTAFYPGRSYQRDMGSIRRILVVDDEPQAVSSIQRHLRREGFITDSASNGYEALQKILSDQDKAPFDLVIADVIMPVMSGIELLEWISKAYPGISAILISAYGETDRLLASIRPSQDVFSRKPLTPKKMMELIRSVEYKRQCPDTPSS